MMDFRKFLAEKGWLNVAHLVTGSRGNGPGSRAVIWLQGCSIRCEGCVNRSLWEFSRQILVDPVVLVEKIRSKAPDCEGITVTGGEPFDQVVGLARLVETAHKANLSILIYTGYTLEDLLQRTEPEIGRILNHTDILIDGPYIDDLHCAGPATGSSNQQVRFLSKRYPERIISSNQEWIHEEYILENQQNLIHTGIFSSSQGHEIQ